MRIDVIPGVSALPPGRAARLQVLVRLRADAEDDVPVPAPGAGHAAVAAVAAAAAVAPPARRRSLALALVLDRSSSMRGRPLRHAAEAARLVASRLDQDDRLCIVTFDREVSTLFGPEGLDERSRVRLSDRLDYLMSGYLTNLGGGLTEGCKRVAPFARAGMPTRVVLLTDGLPSYGVSDAAELCELAAFYHEFGITISAVGLGIGFDEELLTRIATRGGGSFHFVRRSDEVPAALSAELTDLFHLAAEGSQVRIDMTAAADGVDVLHAYPAAREGAEVVVDVGEVYTGAPRLLLLEFALPEAAMAAPGEVRVASLSVRYRRGGRGISEERVTVTTQVQAGVAEAATPEVARQAALLRAAAAEQAAVRRADAGDLRAAREILEQAAEALRAELGADAHAELRRKLSEICDAADRLRAGEYGHAQRKAMVQSAWRTHVSRVAPMPRAAAPAGAPPHDKASGAVLTDDAESEVDGETVDPDEEDE
ncbi:MAG TPA: VWA domain-containing protein [Myxococcota bacterium]|jgi:Ca-activated chloride channel family protein|nr:VWA domain-containing protein [Myxococcota bacterium]